MPAPGAVAAPLPFGTAAVPLPAPFVAVPVLEPAAEGRLAMPFAAFPVAGAMPPGAVGVPLLAGAGVGETGVLALEAGGLALPTAAAPDEAAVESGCPAAAPVPKVCAMPAADVNTNDVMTKKCLFIACPDKECVYYLRGAGAAMLEITQSWPSHQARRRCRSMRILAHSQKLNFRPAGKTPDATLLSCRTALFRRGCCRRLTTSSS